MMASYAVALAKSFPIMCLLFNSWIKSLKIFCNSVFFSPNQSNTFEVFKTDFLRSSSVFSKASVFRSKRKDHSAWVFSFGRHISLYWCTTQPFQLSVPWELESSYRLRNENKWHSNLHFIIIFIIVVIIILSVHLRQRDFSRTFNRLLRCLLDVLRFLIHNVFACFCAFL